MSFDRYVPGLPAELSASARGLLWIVGMERDLEPGWAADNLRKEGFAPETVIDVGVAAGTPELYAAFPSAYHVLLEPLAEFEPHLKRILTEVRGEYSLTAVGSEEGSVTIHVDEDGVYESSLLNRTWSRPEGDRLRAREVEVTTLDALLAERSWSPPFGLKIDVEGFEHRVVEGASALLEQTQFVIAEVSTSKRFHESYSFADFIRLMQDRGFELCDVLDGMKIWTREVVYVDLMFRRSANGDQR